MLNDLVIKNFCHIFVTKMRKLYFRYMLKLFRDWEHTVSVKYVYNLRIVRTELVTMVLVNMWGQKKMSAYFYYMPDKTFLGYDTIYIDMYPHHKRVYGRLIRTIKRIEEDEVYRLYRSKRQEYICAKRDGK